jgi:VanZ family protein
MNRLVLLLVAICSIATMLYFSSRTAEISSQQSQMIINIIKLIGIEPSSYFIRKLAHFTIFTIIGFCISMFIGSYDMNKIISTLLSFTLTTGYACIDEYIQTFIPGRNGSINDVMIDISGVIIGILLYNIVIYFISNN